MLLFIYSCAKHVRKKSHDIIIRLVAARTCTIIKKSDDSPEDTFISLKHIHVERFSYRPSSRTSLLYF